MSAVQTVALVAPTVAAQAIFSGRRAKKGADNFDEYPLFGLMNFDLALGQFLKGTRAAKAAAVTINSGASDSIKALAETTKDSGGIVKTLGPVGKVLDYTAYHINPIIWTAAAIKGLGSKDEDKPTALLRELIPVGSMRLCEEGYNYFIGMPKTVKNEITKKQENLIREGAYKRLFNEKQKNAINQFIETKILFEKIPVKNVAGVVKGVGFVLTSIGGYKLGESISDRLLGKKTPNMA